MSIIDQEAKPAVTRPLDERPYRLAQEVGWVVDGAGAIVSTVREKGSEGPERQPRCRSGAHHALGDEMSPFSPAQRLSGKPSLAHAGRTGDDNTPRRLVPESLSDLLELWLAAKKPPLPHARSIGPAAHAPSPADTRARNPSTTYSCPCRVDAVSYPEKACWCGSRQ